MMIIKSLELHPKLIKDGFQPEFAGFKKQDVRFNEIEFSIYVLENKDVGISVCYGDYDENYIYELDYLFNSIEEAIFACAFLIRSETLENI